MHLIGLIVEAERVHHEVHAEAEGHLALDLATRRDRHHAAATLVDTLTIDGLDGATDRVRGSLAGCDAYLTKPLHESEFIATLLQVDPAFEWQADAVTAA